MDKETPILEVNGWPSLKALVNTIYAMQKGQPFRFMPSMVSQKRTYLCYSKDGSNSMVVVSPFGTLWFPLKMDPMVTMKAFCAKLGYQCKPASDVKFHRLEDKAAIKMRKEAFYKVVKGATGAFPTKLNPIAELKKIDDMLEWVVLSLVVVLLALAYNLIVEN